MHGESVPPWEKEFIRKDGSFVPVIVGCVATNKEAGEFLAFTLDISERKKLEQRKDEFIGIASHELKTPLTSIKGYTQILERIIRQMGDDKLKLYLRKTNVYIDRLDSLIADLLDVSKIQAGKLQMNFSTFPFHELLAEGIETMQHTYSQHRIIVKGNIDAEITGDKHRLEQVFTNLLSNAIKYSPEADRVEIDIKKNSNSLQIGIRDYGIGIDSEQVPKLFRRFYRIDERATQFSGLGIGLYISNQIVKRHGGKMWVRSQPGEGSIFYFTLPVN